MHRSRIHAITRSALVLAVGAAPAWGLGPLNPPGGPVSSTFKTLSEVEPRIAVNATNTPGNATATFRITQAGSYYLTGNLSGENGRSCIEIATSNVTLDLMGFRILGSGGANDAIVATAGQSNITVRNGSVRTFGGNGVNLGQAANARIIDITARNCDGVGVVAGEGSVLTRVIADSNVSGGIHVLQRSVLDSCAANDNLVFGFQVNSGSTVTGCSAGANLGDGFLLENGCTITASTAYNNTRGIVTLSGCSVIGCTTRLNNGDGIRVASSCIVRDNACSSNGAGTSDGAGILAAGSDNRVEGNTCTGADRGIDVNGTRNVIIRNTCAGNTVNWSLVANNIYGPILDRSAVATGAVNGNAAASTLGTTDANANFTH